MPTSIKQLTVWTENRPGRLAEVAAALGDENVNIFAFWAGPVGDRWAIRLIVDEIARAKNTLTQLGWEVAEEDLVAVPLHKPGALRSASKKLETAGMNIEYAYTGWTGRSETLYGFLAVTDLEIALKALGSGTKKHLGRQHPVASERLPLAL